MLVVVALVVGWLWNKWWGWWLEILAGFVAGGECIV